MSTPNTLRPGEWFHKTDLDQNNLAINTFVNPSSPRTFYQPAAPVLADDAGHRFPLGTARVKPEGSALAGRASYERACVSFLTDIDASEIEVQGSHPEARKDAAYSAYMELAARGTKPPYIDVRTKAVNGTLVWTTQDRKRTLVAQELGQHITCWMWPLHPMTQEPLRWIDVEQATEQAVLDSMYLEALQTGDHETCRKVLRDAASAAGFDPQPLWHGTGKGGFDAFSTTVSRTAYGIYLTPERGAAEYYALGEKPTVYELYAHLGNCFDAQAVAEYEAPIPEWLAEFISDEFGDADDLDADASPQSRFIDWLSSGDLYAYDMGRRQNALMREAQGHGFDSVKFHDARGGGGVATSVVVFEPERLKSAALVRWYSTDVCILPSARFGLASTSLAHGVPEPVIDLYTASTQSSVTKEPPALTPAEPGC